jgi:hypothetical protein
MQLIFALRAIVIVIINIYIRENATPYVQMEVIMSLVRQYVINVLNHAIPAQD